MIVYSEIKYIHGKNEDLVVVKTITYHFVTAIDNYLMVETTNTFENGNVTSSNMLYTFEEYATLQQQILKEHKPFLLTGEILKQ